MSVELHWSRTRGKGSAPQLQDFSVPGDFILPPEEGERAEVRTASPVELRAALAPEQQGKSCLAPTPRLRRV